MGVGNLLFRARRLTNPATPGQRRIERTTRSQRAADKDKVTGALVGAGTVAALSGLGIAELRSRLKEAKTEKEQAQIQAAIEKLLREMAVEEGNKKAKGGMMTKKYAKGGYANCGASMPATQASTKGVTKK
jgi:glutamate 5-kinase